MCFVRASELMNTEWFRTKKAHIVFVSTGSPEVGKTVGEELGIFKKGAQLFVDDTTASVVYVALGARRGILRTFTLTRWDNLQGLFFWPVYVMKGHMPTVKYPFISQGARRPKSSAGDPYQQGATFIFDEKQQLRYRQIEETPGNPKVDYRMLKLVIEEGVTYGLVTVRLPETGMSGAVKLVLLVLSAILVLAARIFQLKLS